MIKRKVFWLEKLQIIVAKNWENRNVLFDGENKNSCRVDMDYISNLLCLYMFHRV